MAANKFDMVHFVSKEGSTKGDFQKYLKYLFADDAKNRIAVVAYVGKSPASLLKGISLKGVTVVCDATSIGTHPEGLEKMLSSGVTVRSYPRLHSKVYLSSKGALVGSGNFSWNGFGDSGAHLEEAFVWIPRGVDPYSKVSEYCESMCRTPKVSSKDLAYLKFLRDRHNMELQKTSFSKVRDSNNTFLCLWFGEMTIESKDVKSVLDDYGRSAAKDVFEESVAGAEEIVDSSVRTGMIIPYEMEDELYVGPQKILGKRRVGSSVLFVVEKLETDDDNQLNKASEVLLGNIRELLGKEKDGHKVSELIKKTYGDNTFVVTTFGKANSVSSVFVEFNSVYNYHNTKKASR